MTFGGDLKEEADPQTAWMLIIRVPTIADYVASSRPLASSSAVSSLSDQVSAACSSLHSRLDVGMMGHKRE